MVHKFLKSLHKSEFALTETSFNNCIENINNQVKSNQQDIYSCVITKQNQANALVIIKLTSNCPSHQDDQCLFYEKTKQTHVINGTR